MTPPATTKVLIIGGYGTFGLRLVRLLADHPGMTVFVAGRSEHKAFRAVSGIRGATILVPTALDRSQPIDHPPVDVVVDAVGPFQRYGPATDHVIEFCERAGVAYIDLSDDPAFCAHMVARADGSPVTVATGWSTYAAVTGAAVHALGGSEPPVVGIVPSPRLPMGRAVIASVLDSAGKEIGPDGAKGLTRTIRRTVAPPGSKPMRNLLFSNVPTPDTVLVDPRTTAWTAPQPEVLHRLLIVMARLRGWRLLPPLRWFLGLIHRVQAVVQIGEPRGGLFVEVGDRRFDLIGEGDTGPSVPATPAAALIRALHAGETFPPGLLRPGADFPLSRLTPLWDEIGIDYGIRQRSEHLYADTLGLSFGGGAMDSLPEPIADLHTGGTFTGRATVERGRNPLGRIVASVLGFPKAGEHDLRVSITTDGRGVEHWSRVYAGREMFSTQERGAGRATGLITERFGPFAVHLAISAEGDRLVYRSRGWSFLNIPLPRMLAPGGEVFEFIDSQGRFNFHVDMRAPGFGRLVRYQGYLSREPEAG